MGDQDAAGDQQAAGDETIKAELAQLKADNESLKKSNEELRVEFLSDDYLNFINDKGKPVEKKEEKKAEAGADDDFEKLSKKQIFEMAVKHAEDKFNAKITEKETLSAANENARIASEIKDFASSHDDFGTYKPIMYGLSLDPKHANADLGKLYDLAKKHVAAIAGATQEEKEKANRASRGEKPGSSSSSFQRGGKKLSADEANEEAWEEVVGKNGGLPTAV